MASLGLPIRYTIGTARRAAGKNWTYSSRCATCSSSGLSWLRLSWVAISSFFFILRYWLTFFGFLGCRSANRKTLPPTLAMSLIIILRCISSIAATSFVYDLRREVDLPFLLADRITDRLLLQLANRWQHVVFEDDAFA